MKISKIKEEIRDFMIREGMHYSIIDFEKEAHRFSDEMKKGLSHGKSSLKMIPAYIEPSVYFEYDKPIIVIDAGGTNFRRAVVTIKSNDTLIEDLKVYSMPGSKVEMTKGEFIHTILQYIEPIIHRSDSIGFCFSYPVEILPDTDGKVVTLTKEIQVKDIENTILGKELNNGLKEMGYHEKKNITVLNDTTAALLSGLSDSLPYDAYIGLIVGTGMNTSYSEANNNILKNSLLKDNPGLTVVNLESGGYHSIPRGSIDGRLDKKTKNPQKQLMEKMVSGAYQGILVTETLKKAAEEFLFSDGFTAAITEMETLLSQEVSRFIDNPYEKDHVLGKMMQLKSKEEDLIKLYYLIDMLLQRAAKIIAINIKGILLQMNGGKNPCKPVCLTVDGSTFYGSSTLQQKTDYYIEKYLINKGYYIKRIKKDQGIMIGAAIAALLNGELKK
ncbi:MAG: hexokinase [Eubacteriales bacterium]